MFFLDRCSEQAAALHYDRHVGVMLKEACQILSTARAAHGLPAPYRPYAPHHPTVRWAGAAGCHYVWVHRLATALAVEHLRRFGRVHGAGRALEALPAALELPGTRYLDRPWQDPPQVMPVEYRQADTVAAYRAYYLDAKGHLQRPSDQWRAAACSSV